MSLALAATSLAMAAASAEAHAVTWSLADDFSIAQNSDASTWSYRLDDNATPPNFPLLTNNARNANALWGTGFASPPLMWNTGAGYWGIGRNDSGVLQSSSTVNWAPGEILLHPKNHDQGWPSRLAVSWLAPQAMTIDVSYTFAKAMNVGNNGIGYSITQRTAGGDIELKPWTYIGNYGVTLSDSLSGLSIAAGDRLFFRFDNWGDAGGDIARAAITITTPLPPPTRAWSGAISSAWNATAQNWKDEAGAAATYSDGHQVLFDDTVGLGSRMVAISGSGVAPGTISFDNTVDYALQSSGGFGIKGPASLVKTGSGTLTISGTNTYTGGTMLSGGRLKFAGNHPLPAAGAVQISNGAQLDLDRFSAAVGAVTLADGSITGTGTATLMGSEFSVQKGTISAVLDGMFAGLTKTTANTVVLAATNTYGGPTDILGGTLRCDADAIPGDVTIANNSVLDLRANALHVGVVTLTSGTVSSAAGAVLSGRDYLLESGAIGVNLGDQDGSPLVKSTSGTVVLSGDNTYTGGTEVAGGILRIASAGALPAGQSLTIQTGGTLVLGGGLSSGAGTGAAAVPEPSTFFLLATAAAGLLFGSGARRSWRLHQARRTP